MSGTYARVGSGALSGAAAGSAILPGWGTAAGAVLGGIMGGLQGDGGSAAQQQIEANNLQNQRNQQQYAQALSAEALKRSVAGSTDAQGSTIRYDPSTNSWVSTLGAQPQANQAALSSADLLHNSVEVPLAAQNNAASAIQASLARRGLSGAINNLQSYTPISQEAMLGALQDSSTRANAQAQNPIIDAAVRESIRTGTAAGPVLAQLQRQSTDSLAKEMSDNVVNSMTGAANVNSANRASLAAPIATLMQAGTPTQESTQGSYTPGPASELAAQINGRAASSGTVANQAATGNLYGGIAGNQAANQAATAAGNVTTPADIAGAYKSIANLTSKKSSDGSSGDSGSPWGNIGSWINSQFGGGNSSAGFGVASDGSYYGPQTPAMIAVSQPNYSNM